MKVKTLFTSHSMKRGISLGAWSWSLTSCIVVLRGCVPLCVCVCWGGGGGGGGWHIHVSRLQKWQETLNTKFAEDMTPLMKKVQLGLVLQSLFF